LGVQPQFHQTTVCSWSQATTTRTQFHSRSSTNVKNSTNNFVKWKLLWTLWLGWKSSLNLKRPSRICWGTNSTMARKLLSLTSKEPW
jgi:hypothetical protein